MVLQFSCWLTQLLQPRVASNTLDNCVDLPFPNSMGSHPISWIYLGVHPPGHLLCNNPTTFGGVGNREAPLAELMHAVMFHRSLVPLFRSAGATETPSAIKSCHITMAAAKWLHLNFCLRGH
jgi:hypothetical protein